MERDNFQCRCCRSKAKTLTVHHCIYQGDPWEGKDEDCQTLCIDCHSYLGPHPKGGIKWENSSCRIVFRYIHCPSCGCKEMRDKGTYEKCNECGHGMQPDNWPQIPCDGQIISSGFEPLPLNDD